MLFPKAFFNANHLLIQEAIREWNECHMHIHVHVCVLIYLLSPTFSHVVSVEIFTKKPQQLEQSKLGHTYKAIFFKNLMFARHPNCGI
jgi:hypothetical protein